MMRKRLSAVVTAGILSAIFITFLSSTTSFINSQFGGDSAIFRFIGTSMARGQSLYVDVWDHKGPGLFLIQWLAQELWEGRAGIFLLQIVSLFTTLLLLQSIARRFLSPSLTFAAQIAFLALLAPVYEYGNLTEEWTLPFSLFVIWVLTKAWHLPDGVANRWALIGSGGAFAFLVFVRLNNAAAVIAVFVAYFTYVLVTKRNFWPQFLAAVGGFILVCAVFIGGFAAAGTLSEMMYATFIFNLRYTAAGTPGISPVFSNGYFAIAIGMAALTLIGGFVDAQLRKRPWYLLLSASLVTVGLAATLTAARGYHHYLQLLVPGATVGIILLLQIFSGRLRDLIAVTVVSISLFPLCGFAKFTAEKSERSGDREYSAQVADIMQHIPANERTNVYTWNIRSQFYLIADILPIQRFSIMQQSWGRSDPRLYTEVNEFLLNSSPKWLVMDANGIEQPETAELVEERYREVSKTQKFILMKRSSEH